MRRKVLDSNGLESEQLLDFLKKSHRNHVLLTEAVNAEMHQDYALRTLRRGLEIVGGFSRQVELTKTMKDASLVDPRTKGLGHRLLDPRHTVKFRHFCRDLFRDDRDEAVGQTILQNEAIAQRRRARETATAERVTEVYQEIASNFKPIELDEIRRRKVYSADTQRNLVEIAFAQSKHMEPKRLQEIHPAETIRQAVNQFPFRYTLAAVLLFTRWVEGGRQLKTKPEKHRNDLVDITVAVFGTYFHGVLTRDKKLIDVHRELRFVLRSLGGYVPITAAGQRW